MFKEVYEPQVKVIGNYIREVLTRERQKYRDIASLSIQNTVQGNKRPVTYFSHQQRKTLL